MFSLLCRILPYQQRKRTIIPAVSASSLFNAAIAMMNAKKAITFK